MPTEKTEFVVTSGDLLTGRVLEAKSWKDVPQAVYDAGLVNIGKINITKVTYTITECESIKVNTNYGKEPFSKVDYDKIYNTGS